MKSAFKSVFVVPTATVGLRKLPSKPRKRAEKLRKIVLGGFGPGLGSQFSWSEVMKGDVLQIQIQTSSGFTTYCTVAS